ncbi:MAG: M48 family metalloprotease [Burkholderiales bacterium]
MQFFRVAKSMTLVALQISVAVPAQAVEMPGFLKRIIKPHEGGSAPPAPTNDLGPAPGGSSGVEAPTTSRGRAERGPRERPSRLHATGSTEDGVRIQEIHRGNGKASVVLDKHCRNIVQPYSLSDNVASVGVFAAGQALKNLPAQISGRGSSPRDTDISVPAKDAAKQMNWLPMNAEILYGERAHNQETTLLERESKLGRKFYPLADKMLSDVLAGVNERHEYKFKVFILKNSTRNALARPGGFIYLDQGLIDDPAQHSKAYFALAHEISHVLQRHETKELQSMIVDSMQTKSDLNKVMSSVRGNPSVILSHVKVQKNFFTQHHIDQELQADSCAARVLSRVFADKGQLASSLQAFLKDLPNVAATKPVQQQSRNSIENEANAAYSIVKDPIRRHPTTQQRYDNLRTIYYEITRGAGSNGH